MALPAAAAAGGHWIGRALASGVICLCVGGLGSAVVVGGGQVGLAAAPGDEVLCSSHKTNEILRYNATTGAGPGLPAPRRGGRGAWAHMLESARVCAHSTRPCVCVCVPSRAWNLEHTVRISAGAEPHPAERAHGPPTASRSALLHFAKY